MGYDRVGFNGGAGRGVAKVEHFQILPAVFVKEKDFLTGQREVYAARQMHVEDRNLQLFRKCDTLPHGVYQSGSAYQIAYQFLSFS